ncbi:Microtubule binding protein, partial [Operophtera brumata]
MMISEIREREERSKNIIIMGVLEPLSDNRDERKSLDRKEVLKLTGILNPDCLEPTYIVRIGKFNSTQDTVKSLLRNKSNIKLDGLKVFSDQTPQQQMYMKHLKEQLKQRSDDGDRDLTIKYIKGITLERALPPGLDIQLPGEWLELEPETCYSVTLLWTPTQPTAVRETIRFTNECRGRYDVIVVLKSIMDIKGKNQPKGFKTSPGKRKKKIVSKKSPVSIYKKKAEIIYNTTTRIQKTVNVVQTTQHKVYQTSNKENISNFNDYSIDTYTGKCPFDSPASSDVQFDTTGIFSDMRKTNILQETYDKSDNVTINNAEVPQNVLQPSNRHNVSATNFLDDVTFTPLKSLADKTDKLDKGPKIILSLNSASDFDDSLDLKNGNKENQAHSILSITTLQPANKCSIVNHQSISNLDNQFVVSPTVSSKKHPNTSSPKEVNSPNFSINTDFSRISDLSFFPQRFSTERKCFPKINETQDILDEKMSSDTYTKESPNTPMEYNVYQMIDRPPHFFTREQPKICRQSLFREYNQLMPQHAAYEKHYLNPYEHNVWQTESRADVREARSPPRSITPPLQSIPEESVQSLHCSKTHDFDKTDQQMSTFTINRTFDKTHERSSMSTSCRQTWAKKAVRCEPDLWKMPVALAKKSMKSKSFANTRESVGSKVNTTFASNKTSQNITINQIGNVYSQSFTVDPFLSSTYYYDEEAVDRFENEFKKWLNCILTPPADLDSNVEQKIDVGKAWIENRNREVPVAPTKEYVSNLYHNSHRLKSLRKSARALLMSPENSQVFLKLNAQIEKKLIAIRTDRNLHLDVGLQKLIMELILSYNPLWLRIGLEAIYGIVLPLKSNNDIEGLTTFIIQRMFKNPHLKNKNSKSNAPNMLLPAYMEAIKKFTLKKFFMLVLFLDQAKQRKLIQHDPCLFCRNAICKESREIVIRFTREVIAGIGDITKHLRPLGYVVCHKQSYLDEYKYAVHNLALDIKDGVRLTKVMEIIMMKNGLLNQLRTPAISRLQKIHNVQVALNALKEANFKIDGEITAADIADGHREKTLSLLWQLIHVFRAPLFEKAANVLQTWWRKKYEVIVEKRRKEEKARMRLTNAASTIQYWWRRIQYNRQVEWQMQRVTSATIVVQKYSRMWLCRTRLRKIKTSVLKIETWYRSIRMIREAKFTYQKLRFERQEMLRKSAVLIQSYVRRWLCMKHYNNTVRKIIHLQTSIRRFIVRTQYLRLKDSVTFIQQKYRGKLIMRLQMRKLAEQKQSVILVQSYYRMIKQRRFFVNIKKSVQVLEDHYIALLKMRAERKNYIELKKNVIAIQALYRSKKCRMEYERQRDILIRLQRKFRANQLMKNERTTFLQTRNAAIILQKHMKSYLTMKKIRNTYIEQLTSTILIQRYFRSYLLANSQRKNYLQLRNATITLQKRYRSLLLMRRERSAYLKLKNTAVCFQRRYRAQVEMRKRKQSYKQLRDATLSIQHRYRSLIKMRKQRITYWQLKLSCLIVQRAYRAYALGKRERANYLIQKQAAVIVQNWFRNCKKGKEIKEQFQLTKQACVTIQTYYKAYIIGTKQRQEYIRIRTATICIQKYYRSYVETRTIRQQFIHMKTSTVKIQRFYKSRLDMKKQREAYLQMKSAVSHIETCYRRYREYQIVRKQYLELRKTNIYIQRKYRSVIAMRLQRCEYMRLKQATATVQQRYRALLAMRAQRKLYVTLREAVVTLQIRYRAQRLMKQTRTTYMTTVKRCVSIQRFYRAYTLGSKQRHEYLRLKQATVNIQRRYKALLAMRKERNLYVTKLNAAVYIQKRFRAQKLMLKTRKEYTDIISACKVLQSRYRAYLKGKTQREEYARLKSVTILIQTSFRMLMETRKVRCKYLVIRSVAIMIQRRFRENKRAHSIRQNEAATKIQIWFRSVQKRNACCREYLHIRKAIITIQSVIRMFIHSNRFLELKSATLTIQRYYRSYKQGHHERQTYLKVRIAIIKLQSHVRSFIHRQRYLRIRTVALKIQAVYRLKRQRALTRKLRESAAVCLLKNIRRYLAQSWYRRYREKTVLIQRIWRGKLYTRLIRCVYLHKRRFIINLQSLARGYLIRKLVQFKKQHALKLREEKREYWAASKIQSLFRGHRARVLVHESRVVELRRRWREGALRSTQDSMRTRHEEAMEVLKNISGIEIVINAFRSLELLTAVFPITYNDIASWMVGRVYEYMSVLNRSVSSVEVLKSAASIL